MPNTGSFGLLVKAEFVQGSLVMVAVDPDVLDESDIEYGGRPYNFLYYIAWLIYHDLCTAKVITLVERKAARRAWQETRTRNANQTSDYKPKFIYIQRRIYLGADEQMPVRKESSSSAKCPHHVAGHCRIGRMSDSQRLRIQSSLGGEMILAKIKELGDRYTYIFPYETGQGTSQERKWHPVFVEADFMRRLKVSLEKTK
jgi:hypothetical protein